MTRTDWYHGGAVFLGSPGGALCRISRIITDTLENFGHPLSRQSVLAEVGQARLITPSFLVKVAVAPVAGKATPHFHTTLTLCPIGMLGDASEQSQQMLATMLYQLIEEEGALQIEWLDDETVLSAEQFAEAFLSTPRTRDPRAARRASRSGDMNGSRVDVEAALAQVFRTDGTRDEGAMDACLAEDVQPNDIQRLTAWSMTGLLVFLSAPVALSLAAVNLIRGEDFRLNTQVLSMTVFVVTVAKSGVLETLAGTLPI